MRFSTVIPVLRDTVMRDLMSCRATYSWEKILPVTKGHLSWEISHRDHIFYGHGGDFLSQKFVYLGHVRWVAAECAEWITNAVTTESPTSERERCPDLWFWLVKDPLRICFFKAEQNFFHSRYLPTGCHLARCIFLKSLVEQLNVGRSIQMCVALY